MVNYRVMSKVGRHCSDEVFVSSDLSSDQYLILPEAYLIFLHTLFGKVGSEGSCKSDANQKCNVTNTVSLFYIVL